MIPNARLALAAAALASLSFALPLPIAQARPTPLKVFKGEVILSPKRFPFRFKSDAHMIKHMKKVKTKKIRAAKEGQGWSFHYMVFPKKPIGSLQGTITYYDVTDGAQARVDSSSLYLQDASDTIVSGKAKLDRDENKFLPNRRYRMVVSRGYGHPPLAEVDFTLLPAPGETIEAPSGEVNF